MKYQLQLQEEKQRMQQYLSDQFRQLAAATLDPYMEGVEIQSINAAQAIGPRGKGRGEAEGGRRCELTPGAGSECYGPLWSTKSNQDSGCELALFCEGEAAEEDCGEGEGESKDGNPYETARHGTVELGRQEDHSTLFGGAVGHSRGWLFDLPLLAGWSLGVREIALLFFLFFWARTS